MQNLKIPFDIRSSHELNWSGFGEQEMDGLTRQQKRNSSVFKVCKEVRPLKSVEAITWNLLCDKSK